MSLAKAAASGVGGHVAYIGHILGIYWACYGHILCIDWAYIGHPHIDVLGVYIGGLLAQLVLISLAHNAHNENIALANIS